MLAIVFWNSLCYGQNWHTLWPGAGLGLSEKEDPRPLEKVDSIQKFEGADFKYDNSF